jgi:hypothetical protein
MSLNNNNNNIYQRPFVPLQNNPFSRTQERDVSRPIPHGMDAREFSTPWEKVDFPSNEIDVENTFRYTAPEFKADLRLPNRQTGNFPYEGQLPYSTTPKEYPRIPYMAIPENTQISKVCFNEALDNSGPWYLRSWQIWDNAPFLPSNGDVTKDPRYGIQTKGFTTEYMNITRTY